MPGGMLSLTANGSTPGSGILWAVVPLDGDANKQRGVHGIVLALNAEDVSQTLWTSEQVPGRDRLGLFAKFTPPTVAGGKLFVATYGDNEPLRIYGGNNRPTQFPQLRRRRLWRDRAAAAAADRQPGPRGRHGGARLDRTAHARHQDLQGRRCRVASIAPMRSAQQLGRPSLFSVILPASQDVAGCALLRVTAAAKTAGLQNASGRRLLEQPGDRRQPGRR